MGLHWKTKQALRTQLGKACLAHQCGNASPSTQAITEEEIVLPIPPASLLNPTGYALGPSLGVAGKVSSRFTCRETLNYDYIGLCFDNFLATKTFRIGIQNDDGTGKPDGTYIVSTTFSLGIGGRAQGYSITPTTLTKDKIYHIVVEVISGSNTWMPNYLTPKITKYPLDGLGDANMARLISTDGITWSEETNRTPTFVYGATTEDKFHGQPMNQAGGAPNIAGDDYNGEEWTQVGTKSYTIVKVWAKRYGSPPNDLQLSIYCKTTSSYVIQNFSLGSPSEIPTTYSWIEKTFTSPITLQHGYVYQIIMHTTGGDASNNYIVIFGDTMGVGGNSFRKASWNGLNGFRAWTLNGTIPLNYSSTDCDIAFQLIP